MKTLELEKYVIWTMITLFLALEGTSTEVHAQSASLDDQHVACNNNDLDFQIERYLSYIYSNINTPVDPIGELNQSYSFDCPFLLKAETPDIYRALRDNTITLDSNQLSPNMVATLFKSLSTTSSVTSLSAIIVFGTIASIIAEKFWKIKNQRKSFTQLAKRRVLAKQKHRCAHCNRILVVVDFDHKNGNRGDSREINCQALCPNCHAIKTRQKTVKSRV